MQTSHDAQKTLARLERALVWNLNLLQALKEGLERVERGGLVSAARPRSVGLQTELAHHDAPPQEAGEFSLLNELALRIRELAIPSLAGNPVVAYGILESRGGLGGLACVRIFEAPGRVLIHVDACTARARRKLYRKHLRQRLNALLAALQAEAIAAPNPRSVAAYSISLDQSNVWARNVSVTRVALAFIEVRKVLLTDLGDFTRGPVFELDDPPLPAEVSLERAL